MTMSLNKTIAAIALATAVGLAGGAIADEGADGFDNLETVVISAPSVEISGTVEDEADVDPYNTDDAS